MNTRHECRLLSPLIHLIDDQNTYTYRQGAFIVESQVSNWFINARVRLWKPMVEEMYQHERKDEEEEEEAEEGEGELVVVSEERERRQQQQQQLQAESADKHRQTAAQTPRATPSAATGGAGKRSEINGHDKDASAHAAMNRQCFSENQVNNGKDDSNIRSREGGHMGMAHPDEPHGMRISRMGSVGITTAMAASASASMGSGPPLGSTHHARFGTSTGDVSLTLGLRHMPAEKTRFSIRDFGGC